MRALTIAKWSVPLLLVILAEAGCVSSSGTDIYVTQLSTLPIAPATAWLAEYPGSADGNVQPREHIEAAQGTEYSGVAIGPLGDIYLGNLVPSGQPDTSTIEILVYPPWANGAASPSKTIMGPSARLINPLSYWMAADHEGNIYYYAYIFNPNGDPTASIFVIPPGGGAARTISGISVNSFSNQIAVDSAENVYVAHGDSVLIFDSSANGDVPPSATLGGPDTTIQNAVGAALDGDGNIYVSDSTGRVLEFSADASGDTAPIRTISGSETTLAAGTAGPLAVDEVRNIYVLNSSDILKFGPEASGNAAPTSAIQTPIDSVVSYSIATR